MRNGQNQTLCQVYRAIELLIDDEQWRLKTNNILNVQGDTMENGESLTTVGTQQVYEMIYLIMMVDNGW